MGGRGKDRDDEELLLGLEVEDAGLSIASPPCASAVSSQISSECQRRKDASFVMDRQRHPDLGPT